MITKTTFLIEEEWFKDNATKLNFPQSQTKNIFTIKGQ